MNKEFKELCDKYYWLGKRQKISIYEMTKEFYDLGRKHRKINKDEWEYRIGIYNNKDAGYIFKNDTRVWTFNYEGGNPTFTPEQARKIGEYWCKVMNGDDE